MNTSDVDTYWPSIISKINLDTPFMVVDTNKAVSKMKALKKSLPGVDIYYAVKSSDDPKLIKALKPETEGFDVASIGEIENLIDLGVKPKNMIFSNPVKIPSHIEKAFKLGVKSFGFDSASEVFKLAKYAPGAEVYLRVRVADAGSKFPLSRKFGVEPNQAVAYVATAIEEGLKFIGLSFHVGSQSETTVAWENAIEVASDVINNLSNAGIKTETLNIGGGFPAIYTEPVVSIEELGLVINKAIKKHIPSDIRILAEPGRSISAESAVMVATVIGTEYRSGSHWLYLDIGTFQGLIEPLEIPEWKYPIVNLTRPQDKVTDSFVLSGPTCDAYDTLGMDYVLPKDTRPGDRILIGSAGAYTRVYASTFNGFEPPKVTYAGEGK